MEAVWEFLGTFAGWWTVGLFYLFVGSVTYGVLLGGIDGRPGHYISEDDLGINLVCALFWPFGVPFVVAFRITSFVVARHHEMKRFNTTLIEVPTKNTEEDSEDE